MIIRITAKDVPHAIVEQLLCAARSRVTQLTLAPMLTSEHEGSYYAVVDHAEVAKLFMGALTGMIVEHSEVDELPGAFRVREKTPSSFRTLFDDLDDLFRF